MADGIFSYIHIQAVEMVPEAKIATKLHRANVFYLIPNNKPAVFWPGGSDSGKNVRARHLPSWRQARRTAFRGSEAEWRY
jgi:hypothetical protein